MLLNETCTTSLPCFLPNGYRETCIVFSKVQGDYSSSKRIFSCFCLLSCLVTTVLQMRALSHFWQNLGGQFPHLPKNWGTRLRIQSQDSIVTPYHQQFEKYLQAVQSLVVRFKGYYYFYTCLTASFPGQHGKAGTRKVKPVWIYVRQQMAVLGR